MNILAFDTASSTGAVAIMKSDVIIAHTQLNIGLTHSELLLPAIDSLMKITKMSMEEFDAIAITSGPGSFTGLRIGFSTAKGMALGLGKPLIPIPTLDVLAENGMGIKGLIVPIMNARRNQVYTAVYRGDGSEISRISDYQAIGFDDLLKELAQYPENPMIYFTGDGIDVFSETITHNLAGRVVIALGCRKYVCADALARLAKMQMDGGDVQMSMRAEPLYLRESEAVIKWKIAHPGENLED